MKSDFTTKFGLPRQSGLAKTLVGRIVFEKEYSDDTAFRGLEGFSHIWIIWGFSGTEREKWSASVKPPRLGGNKRMGVFATRSPFRPNPLGLSCVKLERILRTKNGIELEVRGADLMDGTPIYDIKPYLPYADSIENASGGFSEAVKQDRLSVVFPDELKKMLPEEKLPALFDALKGDPRPSYHNDPERRYGFLYAGFDIRFRVADDVLTVCEIVTEEEAVKELSGKDRI